jgi:hypothetical protein
MALRLREKAVLYRARLHTGRERTTTRAVRSRAAARVRRACSLTVELVPATDTLRQQRPCALSRASSADRGCVGRPRRFGASVSTSSTTSGSSRWSASGSPPQCPGSRGAATRPITCRQPVLQSAQLGDRGPVTSTAVDAAITTVAQRSLDAGNRGDRGVAIAVVGSVELTA